MKVDLSKTIRSFEAASVLPVTRGGLCGWNEASEAPPGIPPSPNHNSLKTQVLRQELKFYISVKPLIRALERSIVAEGLAKDN